MTLARRFLLVEIVVGALAMVLGAALTAIVWRSGYYPGAVMLIITGALTLVLSLKEYRDPTPKNERHKVINLFYTILRRAFFFLNFMLSILVIMTFASFA